MEQNKIEKFKSFVKNTLLGGLVVWLPVTIVAAVFNYLYGTTVKIIKPLTDFVVTNTPIPNFFADLLVLAGILAAFFFTGIVIRTSLGKWFHESAELYLLKKIPIYSTVKEIVVQFFGNKQSPFSRVALSDPWAIGTLKTVFVTDESETMYTIFDPTGPNPTSGQIFHLPKDRVQIIPVSVDVAMKSIISCGNGSGELIEAYLKEKEKENKQ